MSQNAKSTFKEILNQKYTKFVNDIEAIIHIDGDVFPPISEDEPLEYDLFLDYIELIFPTPEIKFHVKELLQLKQIYISEDDLEKITPIVSKFLKFIQKFENFLNNSN